MVLCELRTFWGLMSHLPASEEPMPWDGDAGAWASLPHSLSLVVSMEIKVLVLHWCELSVRHRYVLYADHTLCLLAS